MAKDTDYGPLEEGVSMTQETSRKNRKNRDVPGHGWYKHPVSGARAIVQDDPLWGNTQAQAFTQVGFVYERPATEDEITTLPELATDTRKQEEGTLKGLSARLDVLENTNAEQARNLESTLEENKSLQDEVRQLREKLEAAEEAKKTSDKADAVAEKQEAKSEQEAADHIAEAGSANTVGGQEASANQAKNAALDVQSEREKASGQSQNATLKTPEQDAESRSAEDVEAKLDAEKTGNAKSKKEGNGK